MNDALRLLALCLSGLTLGGCALYSADTPRTLGRVSAAPTQDEGGVFLASTPSLLRYAASPRIESNPDLAISHYERVAQSSTDSESQSEAIRRAAYLRIRKADQDAAFAVLPEAIESYEKLLRDKPDDPNNDLALYQLARAYQLNAQTDKAEAALRRLHQEYPQSSLVDDAVFRMAELAFMRRQYEQAAHDYQSVVDAGRSGRFFAMARYKLGWAHFRQQAYRQAILVFSEILDESLPADQIPAPSALDSAIDASVRPWVEDALKVTSLSLAALGGHQAFHTVFGPPSAEPRYAALLYHALAETLLEQERFSDAAASFAAFTQRHPLHALAPEYARREVTILEDAGFADQSARAMMGYVDRYAPGEPYWQQGEPTEQAQATLREYVFTLSRHFHAHGQQAEASARDKPRPETRKLYQTASHWHQRLITLFPDDTQIAESEYLLGESLVGAGRPVRAAAQLQRVAALYADYSAAPNAAYSAVVLLRGEIDNAVTAQGQQRRRDAIAAGLALAEAYPAHPNWVPVMLMTVQDLSVLEDWSRVQTLARQIALHPSADSRSRHQADIFLADAQFAQEDFSAAEATYASLLQSAHDQQSDRTANRLATAIYRQGEQARERGLARAAAEHFLRLGKRVPQSPLRTDADFNAAAEFLRRDDFAAAEPVLEDIVWRSPTHQLASEARRRLAITYEKQDKTALAASAYASVSSDPHFDQSMRREAAWKSAGLYEQAGQTAPAMRAYAAYVQRFPRPLDSALDARRRLAALSRDTLGDLQDYSRWLTEIVQAEQDAGGQRTARSREQAAQAALELGRLEAARASSIRIKPPLQRTIIARKQQTDRALDWLQQAADARIEGITTAATHAMGVAYADLANALMNAALPKGINPLEQEAMAVLLEEQAYPLEERAIALYEANLAYLKSAYWGPWILRSSQALAEFLPVQYGKQEQLAEIYDADS